MGTQSALDDFTLKPRQIIVCCDGTNNTLTGGSHDTNVLKLIGQLVPEDAGQVLYYDPGVGAPDQLPPLGVLNDLNRRRERLAGLANGKGIYENIAEAYLFLVDTWRPGDQIYIFGFSRGAFTARCVAGMVNLFGIVRTDSKPLILTLIRVYFSTPSTNRSPAGLWSGWMAQRAQQHKLDNHAAAQATRIASESATARDITAYLAHAKERRSTREEVVEQVREQFASTEGANASVHFVGVWDTVESVGMPLRRRSITNDGKTSQKRGFRHIRHAISMDEHRLTFAPRLYWEDDYTIPDANDANARSLRQRWFRGAHSDVGGGYDTNEAGLSDQAYRWMLNEAMACGLRTDPKRNRAEHLPKPLIAHDPCYSTPWWGVAGLTVRTNVTHRDDNGAHTMPVITEGAASDPQARIHSVWSAVLRTAPLFTLVALVCFVALFCLFGWLGAMATGVVEPANVLSRIWQGALGLEGWQQTYGAGLAANARFSVGPAALATLVDFGLIIAYSWLLGLYGTWAFHAVTARHHPREKVPWYLRLGYAPLCLVAADVTENVLMLLVLWCISQGWLTASLVLGVAMMVVNVLKWTGAIGSAVLIVSGIAVTAWTLSRQTAGHKAA